MSRSPIKNHLVRRRHRTARAELRVFALALALAGSFPTDGTTQPLALVGGRLLDVDTEQVVEQILILDNGRIVERTDELPEDFVGDVIDLGGRWLAPGLNDLHVHAYGNGGPLGLPEVFGIRGSAERMLSVGVTGFLDLSNDEEQILAFRDDQRQRTALAIEAAHQSTDHPTFGADVYSAGAAFTVPGGHGTQFPNPAREVSNAGDAATQAREVLARRPDVLKVIYMPHQDRFPSLDRSSMEAVVAEARDAAVPVVVHISDWEGARHVVDAGASALTHTIPEPPPPSLIAAMQAAGTAIIPTLAVHLDLDHFAGHSDRLEGELLQRTSLAEFRAHYLDPDSFAPSIQRWRTRQRELRESYLEAVEALHRGGVVVLAGSDAGNPGTFQGASLHRELALLVEAGLSPWAALRGATSHAGALLRRKIGLAPGDLANLVVFEASPIEDITNTASVSLVILHGRPVDMGRLDLPGEAATFTQPSSDATDVDHSQGANVTPGPLLASGFVAAPSGYRLSHVEVGLRMVGDTTALLTTRTSPEGLFELRGEVDQEAGRWELIATYPGFDPVVHVLKPGDASTAIELVLAPSRFQETIVVEAISPDDEALRTQEQFSFLDIVAGAGANADPLFAAQALPGVIKVDEGSGLFVRGGDTSEVATYLDRSRLDHPYRNETPTGGFFGTVDAFELEGLSLAAGGFSAQYGNALSAVLELRTRAPSVSRRTQFTVGLAAASLSFERAVGDNASFRLAANRRDAQPLVDLNSVDLDFPDPPSGRDLSTRFRIDLGARYALDLAAYDQTSSTGIEVESGNFVGRIDSEDDGRFVTATWSATFGDETGNGLYTTSAAASYDDHTSEVAAGVLDILELDDTWRLRLDVDRALSAWTLRAGATTEEVRRDSRGTLPEVGGDFAGDQGTELWSFGATGRRSGGYVEAERSLGERVAFRLGARWDEWTLPRDRALDPRAAASVRLTSRSFVRAAWGRYSQSPDPAYFTLDGDGAMSVPALEVARAEHRVLTWQFGDLDDAWQVRVEAYDKRYSGLPLQTDRSSSTYTSIGKGHARGADLLFRFQTPEPGPSLRSGWRGRVSLTWLDAERRYTPWQDDRRFEPPGQPFEPDFAIPRTLHLVVYKSLPGGIESSLGWRFADGRPFTPVFGAVESDRGLEPVYGPINSERLPSTRRLDWSASRAFALGGASLLAFVGVNDVLDQRNSFRVVYNRDWSERRLARTAFGRTVYFGVSLDF